MNLHVPVLKDEVLEIVKNNCDLSGRSSFVDGTFGGGGHAASILETFKDIKILGCDQDQSAILEGQKNLKKFVAEKRLEFFHGSFCDLPAQEKFSGFLLDLGYSSNQLESPDYGMSFQVEGPLDMRLTRPVKGPSAWDLLTDGSADWLEKIFQSYGEFSGAGRFTENLKRAIAQGKVVNSTVSLAQWIKEHHSHIGTKQIHPATKVFQALRIAVNDELRNLDEFLKSAILKSKENGILLVITFHSLEDRIVKTFGQKMRSNFVPLTKKPVVPTEEEIKKNARSRSAKLRAYRLVSGNNS